MTNRGPVITRRSFSQLLKNILQSAYNCSSNKTCHEVTKTIHRKKSGDHFTKQLDIDSTKLKIGVIYRIRQLLETRTGHASVKITYNLATKCSKMANNGQIIINFLDWAYVAYRTSQAASCFT